MLKRWKGKIDSMERVTSKSHLIEARVMGLDCNCCKKCTNNFIAELKICIINVIYSGLSQERMSYLLYGPNIIVWGCKSSSSHLMSAESKQNTLSLKYFVIKGYTWVQVCHKVYMTLHSINSNKVMEHLNKLLEKTRNLLIWEVNTLTMGTHQIQ